MYRSPKLLAMAREAPVCFGCQATNIGQRGRRFLEQIGVEA